MARTYRAHDGPLHGRYAPGPRVPCPSCLERGVPSRHAARVRPNYICHSCELGNDSETRYGLTAQGEAALDAALREMEECNEAMRLDEGAA